MSPFFSEFAERMYMYWYYAIRVPGMHSALSAKSSLEPVIKQSIKYLNGNNNWMIRICPLSTDFLLVLKYRIRLLQLQPNLWEITNCCWTNVDSTFFYTYTEEYTKEKLLHHGASAHADMHFSVLLVALTQKLPQSAMQNTCEFVVATFLFSFFF